MTRGLSLDQKTMRHQVTVRSQWYFSPGIKPHISPLPNRHRISSSQHKFQTQLNFKFNQVNKHFFPSYDKPTKKMQIIKFVVAIGLFAGAAMAAAKPEVVRIQDLEKRSEEGPPGRKPP